MWLPPVVQVPLTSEQGDRVRSSVRPVRAAFPEAAGRDGDLRNGSISVSRACTLTVAIWFSRSGSFRSFAHQVVDLSHLLHRCGLFQAAHTMRRQSASGFCNPPVSSSWPRWLAPSCSLARLRPACAASSPASVPAMSPSGCKIARVD